MSDPSCSNCCWLKPYPEGPKRVPGDYKPSIGHCSKPRPGDKHKPRVHETTHCQFFRPKGDA